MPGVIWADPDSKSYAALKNYYPSGGGVEFAFDPDTLRFAVGNPGPGYRSGRSPHQKLADAIEGGPNTVAGQFKRGPDGEIYTDENTGHYHQFWNDEVRDLIESTLSGWTGCRCSHDG